MRLTTDNTNTDQKIIDAIYWLARGDEKYALKIWESPNETELGAIWERVTNNGLLDASEFCWGVETLADLVKN